MPRFRSSLPSLWWAPLLALTLLLLPTWSATAQSDPLPWTYPSAGQRDVSPGTTIQLRFAREIDESTLDAAFSIEPAIEGSWRIGSAQSVGFEPNGPLLAESRYTVTLGTELRDPQGRQVFERPRQWSFTTGPDRVAVSFGGAIPLLYVDPTGKARIPLNPGYPRTTLELVAYELDVPGFATRYGAFEPWQENDIDVSGLAEAHRWSTRVDASDGPEGVALPAQLDGGIYVLEAGGERVGTGRALMVVARHALVAKKGLDGLTAWLSTAPEGAPSAARTVTAHDASGQPLGTAVTDQDGIVRDMMAPQAAFLSAQVEGQTAIVGLDAQWRSGWSWGWGRGGAVPEQAEQASGIARYAGHVHTDRPIYRPGHTVHWKATLRALGRDGYQVPEPTTPITVEMRDAGGNLVQQSVRTADDFGSVDDALPLDVDAALGTWQLRVRVGQQTLYGRFQVEEYVKPDYEVGLQMDRPWYVRGDRATVTVQADYYFGQPVTDAQVVVRLYRYWSWRGENRPVFETTGRTDETGALMVDVPLPADEGREYQQTLWLEAEVTDASRRPVTANTTTVVHPAEFALRLENQRYGVQVGEPVSYTAVATDHDGQPRPGVETTVELRQYERGGYSVLETRRVTTAQDGRAVVSFPGLEAGWYNVEARAVDDRGNRLTARSYAWVWDGQRPWYWYGGLEMELDRESYAPGDTAQILIKSPYTTTALVTVERDEVYAEQVVELRGATTVEVPIQADFAPNATVTVALWQPDNNVYNRAEGQLVLAQRQLVVPADDRRLTVSIEPTAAEARPGDMATFTLRVTDASGAPVAAQASVAVVDKAVLALASDTSGDIFDAFWRGWPTSVTTYDSLKPSQGYAGVPEDAARGGDGGGPAPGAPEPSPEPSADDDEQESQATPRRFFPDTALWEATVETGDDGTATLEMTVPDSLTTWAAMARAVTEDARAGQGGGELLVTQPVIADIALPRFAVQGDHFALDALGRNYADPDGAIAASCTLEAPGLTLLDGAERQMQLPFNQTESSRYSVVASTLGTSPVTARLDTPAGDDALELPLEVVPFTVPSRFASAGAVESAKVFERFEVPFHAVPDASEVELRLAPGVAQSVLDGVDELVGFPYGCVEQTMSRMLPNAVVSRLVQTLGVNPGPELSDLSEYMNVGLQKLYGFQNPNGSWGWWHWEHSEGQVYLTAYVLHGLILARDAGYNVDPAAIDRGFQWLRDGAKEERPEGSQSGEDRNRDPRILAYAAHVIALDGRDDGGLASSLIAQSDGWDPFALSSLAMALHAQGETAAAEAIVARLEALAERTATGAFWPMETETTRWGYPRWDWYQWRTMASAEKHTATALQALLTVRPDSELAPLAARWLLANRHGRGWYTTHATAFAVLGLTDFVIDTGELDADYTWTATLDGRVVGQGTIGPDNVLEPIEPVVLTGTSLQPGEHSLVVEKRGQGTLFYTLLGRMALYHDGFAETEAEGLGIRLSRSYMPVAGRAGEDGWAVGDLINVRLTLETREELSYLIIEDMLPAGLEPLNERLETEGRVPGGSPWRWWGYERKELRDQKVTFFDTWLPAGTHTFEYAARAVTPGTFAARPAEAYAMYRPEVWGRSASAQLEVGTSRLTARPDLGGDFDRDCRLTAFDASLVAADWGAPSTARDLNLDGRVSVADVALASGRSQRALACGDAVPPLPPAAGQQDLALRQAPETAEEGEVVLELVAQGDAPIGAWEATLSLPEGMRHTATAPGDRLPEAWMLEPVVDGDSLRLGGWADADGRAGEVLARITLRAEDGEGGETIALASAEVTTAEGATYEVTVDGSVISPPAPVGRRIWLPYAVRGAGLR